MAIIPKRKPILHIIGIKSFMLHAHLVLFRYLVPYLKYLRKYL